MVAVQALMVLLGLCVLGLTKAQSPADKDYPLQLLFKEKVKKAFVTWGVEITPDIDEALNSMAAVLPTPMMQEFEVLLNFLNGGSFETFAAELGKSETGLLNGDILNLLNGDIFAKVVNILGGGVIGGSGNQNGAPALEGTATGGSTGNLMNGDGSGKAAPELLGTGTGESTDKKQTVANGVNDNTILKHV